MPAEFVEFIDWNRQALEEAAIGVIGFYAKGLAPLGTRKWTRFAMDDLLPIIRGNSAKPVELEAEGFNLTFYGPYTSTRPIIEGERVVWKQAEPRFVVQDMKESFIRPRLKTMLQRVNQEIASEARDYYHLDVQSNPPIYTFPKTRYSNLISVFEAKRL